MLDHIFIQSSLITEKSDFLSKEWMDLNQAFNIPEAQAKSWQKELWKHYQHKKRAYHNLSHICSMLLSLKHLGLKPEKETCVKWAIWLHDIIYNSLKKNNEKKSAELAVDWLKPYSNEEDLTYIDQLIMSTAKHQAIQNISDFHIMLDLDLAVLASSWATYEKYIVSIRKEYSIYPDFLYKKGRKKVLEAFLNRQNIYYTALFKDKAETIARMNIQKELMQL